MIRALVADDSPTARSLLAALLSSDPAIEVVGMAENGREAVRMVRHLRPDVVTMDIQMPVLDGFGATRRIMNEVPTPIVIVSGLDVHDVAFSLEALRAGALALFPKPGGQGAGFESETRQFLATVKAMARVRMVRRQPGPPSASRSPLPLDGMDVPTRPEALGILASTGGPAALHRILSELPGDLPFPILVIQHLAIGFAEGLARWLGTVSPLRVGLATEGEALQPGKVYLAPDNRHLAVSEERTAVLLDTPPQAGFRPSGNLLFESLARVFGPGAMGVVLTGMEGDGLEGLRLLRKAGGRVVAQDETTSDVFGLPAAAIREGLAHAVLPLDAIAHHLTDLARR